MYNFNNLFNNVFSSLSSFSNSLKESLEEISMDIYSFERYNQEYYVVDKVVDNFAICEKSNSKEMVNISLESIKGRVKEGDCLIILDGNYEVNEELTSRRKELINEKMGNLFK